MVFTVDFAAHTDVGLVRSRNEDSGYAGPHLLAVADGMGGHAGGNVASSLVLARLAPLDGDSHGSDDALAILADTIAAANHSLAEEMAADTELQGMGTTLTALMRAGSAGLALVHIGDSRAYLLRGGRFAQITKDHSFVQSLVDSGRISAGEAEHHPQRSLVTRVLTGAPEDEPDLTMREGRLGDRYLICSDGLSDYVALDTITDVITAGLSPQETTKRLIDLALRAGAPDNVTCVVGDLVEAATGPSAHPLIVGAAADNRGKGSQRKPQSPAAKAAALRREATGADDPDGSEGVVLAEEEDSPRRRWLKILLIPIASLIVLFGAGFAGYGWTQQQSFIGESDGRVAIFQGINQDLGPITLSSVRQTTDIFVSDLSEFSRDRVRNTIPMRGPEETNSTLQSLETEAQHCRLQPGRPCGTSAPATTGATQTATSLPATTPPTPAKPTPPASAPHSAGRR